VELAGVHPNDLQVELSADGHALVIRGRRRDVGSAEEARVRFHQMEIYFGPFQRIIPLPPQLTVDREKMQACYRDGFLLVKLPQRAAPPATTVRVTE
jgi:HSP20 family molecular chaperone IbpA